MAAAPETHLVLVPGLMCSPALFAPQVAHFAPRLAVSVAETRNGDSMADIARQILARAPARFALAGLSMGGYIAFEMLRQAPARITRLALLDTNARADRPEQIRVRHILAGLARTMGARAVQGMLLNKLVHPGRLAEPDLTARVLDMADWVGPTAFERQQLAIIGRPDNRPFLAEIRCPTLVLVGAEDALTPVKVHEELAAGIAGSRLVVIPECGHLSTMERPAEVNRHLATWLGT